MGYCYRLLPDQAGYCTIAGCGRDGLLVDLRPCQNRLPASPKHLLGLGDPPGNPVGQKRTSVTR